MDSRRRNYTEIFRELDKLVNSSATYKQDSRLQVGDPAVCQVAQTWGARMVTGPWAACWLVCAWEYF